MKAYCTQNTDRQDCSEEDCCLKSLDKLPPEIKCRCQNCDAKFSRYGKLEGIYVCHCGFEQDVKNCKSNNFCKETYKQTLLEVLSLIKYQNITDMNRLIDTLAFAICSLEEAGD